MRESEYVDGIPFHDRERKTERDFFPLKEIQISHNDILFVYLCLFIVYCMLYDVCV